MVCIIYIIYLYGVEVAALQNTKGVLSAIKILLCSFSSFVQNLTFNIHCFTSPIIPSTKFLLISNHIS